MGLLGDFMALFDRSKRLKRVTEMPAELEALAARVAALEEMLGGKWPGDVCRACGERKLRLLSTLSDARQKVVLEHWHCFACTSSEDRLVNAR